MKINKNYIINFLSVFIPAITAGILIGLVSYIYLKCENKYVGTILFSIGLITICYYHLNLYTGMIGYLFEDFYVNYKKNIICLIGNVIGTWVMALVPLSEKVQCSLNNIILNKTFSQAFYNSLLCGVLIFIAVNIYKRRKSIIGILFCVPCFLLSGMEHSIANMYYFFHEPSIKYFLLIVIYIIGNGIGAIVINFLLNYHLRKED